MFSGGYDQTQLIGCEQVIDFVGLFVSAQSQTKLSLRRLPGLADVTNYSFAKKRVSNPARSIILLARGRWTKGCVNFLCGFAVFL